MSETRARYSPEAILSVMTGGIVLTPLEEIHELITHLLGWPVFTHQLAQKHIWETCAAAMKEQHPEMLPEMENPLLKDLVAHSGDRPRLRRLVDHLRDTYGGALPVERMPEDAVPEQSPFDGLRGKDVAVIVLPDN